MFSATTPNIKDITPKVAIARDIILTDTAIDPKINVTGHLQGTKEFSERMENKVNLIEYVMTAARKAITSNVPILA